MNINTNALAALPRTAVHRVMRLLLERDRLLRELAAIVPHAKPGRKAKD